VENVVLKRFESPDEARIFEKGRLELVRIGAMTVGRASLHLLGADRYAR
jgi:hypothetical protein